MLIRDKILKQPLYSSLSLPKTTHLERCPTIEVLTILVIRTDTHDYYVIIVSACCPRLTQLTYDAKGSAPVSFLFDVMKYTMDDQLGLLKVEHCVFDVDKQELKYGKEKVQIARVTFQHQSTSLRAIDFSNCSGWQGRFVRLVLEQRTGWRF